MTDKKDKLDYDPVVDKETADKKEAAELEKKKAAEEKAAASLKDVVEDAAAKHKAFVDKSKDVDKKEEK